MPHFCELAPSQIPSLAGSVIPLACAATSLDHTRAFDFDDALPERNNTKPIDMIEL
jgi:hypothetical protein